MPRQRGHHGGGRAATNPQIVTAMNEDMIEIEAAAGEYAKARENLSNLVSNLQDELQAIQRRRLPAIRRAVQKAAEREDCLRNLVGDNPHLFQRPKTVVLHGVKLGYQKGKGKIALTDEDQTIRLIRRHLCEQAEVLIVVKERVNKAALKDLPVADLKRIGCGVEEAGDEIVIRSTDSQVDRIVEALLKDTEAENQTAVAA